MRTENILMKNEINGISTDRTGVRVYVTLSNGKEVKAKRSSKGAYIVMGGKRKYIVHGYTYGNP